MPNIYLQGQELSKYLFARTRTFQIFICKDKYPNIYLQGQELSKFCCKDKNYPNYRLVDGKNSLLIIIRILMNLEICKRRWK